MWESLALVESLAEVLEPNDRVIVVDKSGAERKAKILQVLGHPWT